MPFALWDGSHPFQNVAQSVEKFVLQSRQTYFLFMTLLTLSGHKRFQKRARYVFSKVSDSSVPALFSNSFSTVYNFHSFKPRKPQELSF